jgi:hypothetical protein
MLLALLELEGQVVGALEVLIRVLVRQEPQTQAVEVVVVAVKTMLLLKAAALASWSLNT